MDEEFGHHLRRLPATSVDRLLFDQHLIKQIDVAKGEFSTALRSLFQVLVNTETDVNELSVVATQWIWFELSLDGNKVESFRLIVSDASEWILNSMDAITHMYESCDGRLIRRWIS